MVIWEWFVGQKLPSTGKNKESLQSTRDAMSN